VAGPQGIQGVNAYTTATAPFTVPAIGSTVVISVANASWMVVGELLWIANAGGGGQAGQMQVQAVAGNSVTLLNISVGSGTVGDMLKSVYDTNNNNIVDQAEKVQWSGVQNPPATYTPSAHETTHLPGGSDPIPLASATTAGLMRQVSGNTTDFQDGTNTSQPLQPVIWSARLRSYNAVGNPSFEVDQRHAGTLVPNSANVMIQDRWGGSQAGTMVISGQQVVPSYASVVPGTNFSISRNVLRLTLTTQEVTLGAGDNWNGYQSVEGPAFRELQNDVHSLSVLCRSSVANLKFSIYLQNSAGTYSLVKLCSLGAANTPVLITMPNLPIWPAAGNFTSGPGVIAYYLGITLACGSTYIAPAADVWQSGSFSAAPGMSNFAASPVNSTFDLQFIQHEPGPQCTTLMDCPFSGPNCNLEACQRYFTKSYDYGQIAGTPDQTNQCMASPYGTTAPWTFTTTRFPVLMAKRPTVNIYNPNTGTINQVNQPGIGTLAVSSVSFGEGGIGQINLSANVTQSSPVTFHYVADTGW
jgi:hypothetical protein